jgi:hypothetical protein
MKPTKFFRRVLNPKTRYESVGKEALATGIQWTDFTVYFKHI